MAYDGTLKFDTKIDSSGFKNGIAKISSIAKTGLKTTVTAIGAVTAALSAASAAAVDFGIDYQKATNQLQASTGATKEEMEGLSEAMKNVYADNFGESLDDVARSMGEVRKQMGNLDGEEIQGLTEDAITLRDTFEYDVSESVRAANTIVKTFGGDGAQAFSLIAQGAQNGLNYSGELLDSISEYSVQFAKAGLDATDMFNIFQAGMDNGAFNLDKIGDAVKEFSIRAVDGSKSTAEGFQLIGLNADEMAAKFAAGGDEAKDAFYKVIAGLREMEDPVQQNLAGVDLFGTMWEDLGPQVITQLDSVKTAYDETADTMQQLNEIRYNDLGSALETVKRHIQTDLLQPISEGIMPAVSNATDTTLDAISRLAESYKTSGLTGLVEETGRIFAELATKAAEQAPKMVEAAVGFIRAFIDGIADNAPQLIKAAQEIVWALVDGLVKLLPKEVQKPVKETINILKKSFQDGGLRQAINTISKILKDLGKVVTSLAKTLLPPLAKAVDFLGKNLKIIIPLATSAVAAWKTWKIVQQVTSWMGSLQKAIDVANASTRVKITLTAASAAAETQAAAATGASTAALSLKQVAVGVLTGKIGLATSAQWLWNTAMSANPIGVVIGAVSLLATGIGMLCSSFNNGTDVSKELGEAFEGAAEAAADFYNGIQSAESHLSDFNNTLFASSEEQQELQDNMQAVQDGITTICKLATEERRGYTEAEIQQLDAYFEELNQLNEQQLAIEQSKAEAIRNQAAYLSETHKGSLEEYAVLAQEWIKTAQDQADEQVRIINEQTSTELVLLQQAFKDRGEMTQEEYEARYQKIVEEGEKEIEEVKRGVGEVSSVFADGYTERLENDSTYFNNMKDISAQIEEEKERHNKRLYELSCEIADLERRGTDLSKEEASRLRELELEKESLTYNHNNELKRLHEQYNKDFDEDAQEQVGTWMGLLAQTDLYSGKISEENETMVSNILGAYEGLPEDTRQTMKEAMSPMLEEMENAEPGLFAKASGLANGIINRLRQSFDIHSPSRKTRKIFKDVMSGAELGMEDETPKLYKQTDEIAGGILSRFQTAKVDFSALVQKMKATIAAEHARISAPMTSPAQYAAIKAAPTVTSTEPAKQDGKYVAEVRVDLDGREVARATAPFMGEQLAWEG